MKRARPFFLVLLRLSLCIAVLVLCSGSLALAQNGTLDGPALVLKNLTSQQPFSAEGYSINGPEIQSLYQMRQFQPAWNTQDSSSKKDLLVFVDTMSAFAQAHGLEDRHYPTALMKALINSSRQEDAMRLEVLITDWLLRIAHDLNGDKVNLSHLYVGWEFQKPRPMTITDFAAAMREGKVGEYLASLPPADNQYVRLMDALKYYEKILENGGWPNVETGPTIKPQMTDPRLTSIRARLAAEGYDVPAPSPAEPDLYTEDLMNTIVEFQNRNGLDADGNIGAKTLAMLGQPVSRRIEYIRGSMERMRHMPRAFPSRYVMVNIASASLKVIEDGHEVYNAPVVVGRRDRKTPFIQSEIRSVIFNPSWHVPAKIAREDILPKLRKDPHYLEKMGFVVNTEDDEDPHGTQIDWNAISKSEFNFRLRQAPGELNSLGRIKFDFDNTFSVYMHGTPHEELFDKAARHLSSGCIRLKDPEHFATYVLAFNEGGWTEEKVQESIDKRRTQWLKVTETLPLYIVYQTAFFQTADGPIHFRKDVYDYDTILVEALRKNGS